MRNGCAVKECQHARKTQSHFLIINNYVEAVLCDDLTLKKLKI